MIQQINHLNLKQEIEINYELLETYITNRDIKFKTLIIRSNLFDYSNPFIYVKATITVPNKAAAAEPANNTNKKVIFKNCAPIMAILQRLSSCRK